MTWLLMALACVGAYAACAAGIVTPFTADKGLGLPSANLWIDSPDLAALAGVCAAVTLAWLMVFLNTRFNLLRDITRLFAGMFMVIQCATPEVMCRLNTGTVVALAVCLSLIPLYSSYNKPSYTRFTFLAFLLLSAGALTEYALVAYIPLLLMGMGQMRIFTPRTAVAALLGVVTPWWILWAFGAISFSPFPAPDFTSITAVLSPAHSLQLIVTTVATIATGLTLGIINLVKVFSYNSRSRSYNGFITLLLFASCLLPVIDYTNIPAYLTLLNVATAYQCAQFFVINSRSRSAYIVILSLVALYAALYLWGVLTP